jgi:CTP synthase
LQRHGLLFSGYHEREDGTQLMEFLELPGHPFFVATQAHPEFKSRLGNPHPLFVGFVSAALARQAHGTQAIKLIPVTRRKQGVVVA